MFHRDPDPVVSRRQLLSRLGSGFGTLSLASLLAERDQLRAEEPAGALLAPRPQHFPARAKHVIQLFMPGGPSQVDTFDYKPEIARYVGQRPSEVDRKSLRNTKNGLFPSAFGFRR